MSARGAREADLNAYLDGEMTGAELAEFEDWLADNPEMRERLDKLSADGRELKAALDPVLDEPVPERLVETLDRTVPAKARAVWARIAAAVLIFAAGWAAGWAWDRYAAGDAVNATATAERALNAHRVYVSEVLHPVEVGADEKDHLVAWLSKRLGHRLMSPDLEPAGYRLIGGRLLPGDAAAAAQFMYENDSGVRVTLYVAVNPEGRETAFRLAESGGTRAFYWLDGPLGYALAGDIEEERLLTLARAVYSQLIEDRPREP